MEAVQRVRSAGETTDLLLPLWRALVVFRAVTWGFACFGVWTRWDGIRRHWGAIVLLAVMGIWTVVVSIGYSRHWGRRNTRLCALLLPLATTSVDVVVPAGQVLLPATTRRRSRYDARAAGAGAVPRAPGRQPVHTRPDRGYDVCATASDVASAVRIALATRPDVVVMDLQPGDGSGVDATREITAARPDTRVLVLSASAEQTDVLAAVKNGASGYLVKSASLSEFARYAGRPWVMLFSAGLAGLLLGEYRRLGAGPEVPQ